jgi:transcriptional regulator with XRE-family HTH domain
VPETTVDVAALYAALDQKRQAEDLSWRELAARLGLSASTFTRLAQGHRPDVDAFATLLRWLGMPAESFMRSPADAAAPQPEPLAVISSYLRAAKGLRPEDAEALEDIIRTAYRRLVRPPAPDAPPESSPGATPDARPQGEPDAP